MPAYTQVILPDPLYLQPKDYDAIDDRNWNADFIYPGAVASSFQPTFSSGLSLSLAAGAVYVAGQNVSGQGNYRVFKTTTSTIAVGAGHATLPRLDQIIIRVMDNAADASTFNEARIEVIPGTATSGATLDNRTGAANLATLAESSKSVLLLGDVLVPAAAGSISSGAVRDKRVVAGPAGMLINRTTFTSDKTTTSTTEAAASMVVDSGFIEVDANPIAINFFAVNGNCAGDGNDLFLTLFDGSTPIGRIFTTTSALRRGIYAVYAFTPTAGRKNYNIKMHNQSAGTSTIRAGAGGGTGTTLPGFIEIKRG